MTQSGVCDQRLASPILRNASEWTEEFFATRLDALKAEGRYRVFAELGRRAGALSARPGTSSQCRGDNLVLQ